MKDTNRSGQGSRPTSGELAVKVDPNILKEYNEFRVSRGLSPVGGMKIMRTIRISNMAHAGLLRTAISYGMVKNGKGNLSGLIEAIGLGNVRTLPPGVDVDPVKYNKAAQE